MSNENEKRDRVNDACEKVLPEVVCREVSKVVHNGGFELKNDPKVVVRAEPVFHGGKIDGGKIVISIDL